VIFVHRATSCMPFARHFQNATSQLIDIPFLSHVKQVETKSGDVVLALDLHDEAKTNSSSINLQQEKLNGLCWSRSRFASSPCNLRPSPPLSLSPVFAHCLCTAQCSDSCLSAGAQRCARLVDGDDFVSVAAGRHRGVAAQGRGAADCPPRVQRRRRRRVRRLIVTASERLMYLNDAYLLAGFGGSQARPLTAHSFAPRVRVCAPCGSVGHVGCLLARSPGRPRARRRFLRLEFDTLADYLFLLRLLALALRPLKDRAMIYAGACASFGRLLASALDS
jgi:hypothetical protein